VDKLVFGWVCNNANWQFDLNVVVSRPRAKREGGVRQAT